MENKPIRLLVVEDNPGIRMLLRYFLRDTYDLELVGRFDEALVAAARRPFDLFLLDIDLGEQRTGIDLLEQLRRMPAYGETLAVACTAYTMPEDQERFFAAGFDGFIGKPLTREVLLGVLQAVLAPRDPAPHVEAAEIDLLIVPGKAHQEEQCLASSR